MENPFLGGARGGPHEPGFVYIMRLPRGAVKIGCTHNVDDRLNQIQNQYGIDDLYIVNWYDADDMGDAESDAHDAVMEQLNLVRTTAPDGGDSVDWFTVPRGVTLQRIENTVEQAVNRNNMEQRRRQNRAQRGRLRGAQRGRPRGAQRGRPRGAQGR